MKNIIIVLTFFSLMIIQPVFANKTPKPAKCPSIEAIIERGIDSIQGSGSYWTAVTKSKFNTNEDWIFAIFWIHTLGKDEAKRVAERALKTLKLHLDLHPVGNFWQCTWNADDWKGSELYASAHTPAT